MVQGPTFYFLPRGLCNIDISHVWRVTRKYDRNERLLLSHTGHWKDSPESSYMGELIVFKDGRTHFNWKDEKRNNR